MRKRLIWVGAACLCLVIADSVVWRLGTHALANGLDRWEDQARAQGWSVTEKGRSVSGWPFAATLAVFDLALDGGGHAVPGGLQWRAGRTVLSLSLFAPFTLSVEPEGQQTVRLSHMKTIVFNADHFHAEIPLWHGATQTAELTGEGITGGLAGSGHPQDVRVEGLTLHLQMQDGQTAAKDMSGDIHFAVQGVGLPDIGRWPLGDTVSSAAGDVRLSSPNLAGVRGGHDEASAWRDGGGGMVLHDVSLRWGPLALQADAKLGLDDRLQPAGKGTADVSGAAEALDALVDAKVIAPGIGATGKAVLSVMPAAPGSDAIRLPFTLRGNTLSVGPIPLARLSDIIW